MCLSFPPRSCWWGYIKHLPLPLTGICCGTDFNPWNLKRPHMTVPSRACLPLLCFWANTENVPLNGRYRCYLSPDSGMESRPSPTLQPGVKPQPTQRARLRNTCWHSSHCILFWAATTVEGNLWNLCWKQILHRTVHRPWSISPHKTQRFLLVDNNIHGSSVTLLLTYKSKPQVRYSYPDVNIH